MFYSHNFFYLFWGFDEIHHVETAFAAAALGQDTENFGLDGTFEGVRIWFHVDIIFFEVDWEALRVQLKPGFVFLALSQSPR